MMKVSLFIYLFFVSLPVYSILGMLGQEISSSVLCVEQKPEPFVVGLQKVRKKWQEKNDFKIKMRRLKPKRNARSKLRKSWIAVDGQIKEYKLPKQAQKRKRHEQIKKRKRLKIEESSFSTITSTSSSCIITTHSLETTLTAGHLYCIIQDKALQIAHEQKKSPGLIRSELDRVLAENNFDVGLRAPFIVPHCYEYLARIMQRAKFLGLSLQERKVLRSILIASQVSQAEQELIDDAFACIKENHSLDFDEGFWSSVMLDLAVDCDGKSLEQHMYESNAYAAIDVVKRMRKKIMVTNKVLD